MDPNENLGLFYIIAYFVKLIMGRSAVTQFTRPNLMLTVLFPLCQDTNLKGRFGRIFLIQRSCVPLSLVYRAVHVPGCPQDVNSQLYYPAAQRCSCRRCNTRSHHCVRTSRVSKDRCTVTLGGVKNQTQPAVKN